MKPTRRAPGTPSADFPVDAATVRGLLQAQHPDLAHLELRHLGSGWDNEMYRLGETLLVRLPRREAAARLVEREQDWLPLLRDRLPVAVPAPVRVGGPQGSYPWRWSVVEWIDGEAADLASPADDQGEALAAFFGALHRPAPVHAPRSEFRGVPLRKRQSAVEQRLAKLAHRTPLIGPAIADIWAASLAAPDDAADTWVHGDLHPRNVIVRDGRIVAVIDWGDITQGDRATDLAAVWMLLPGLDQRRRAVAACPDVSAATWARARGWAIALALLLLEAGLEDDERMKVIGERTLSRLIEGP